MIGLSNTLLVLAWIIGGIAAAISGLLAVFAVFLAGSSGTSVDEQSAFFILGGQYLFLLLPLVFLLCPYLSQRANRSGFYGRSLAYSLLALLIGVSPIATFWIL